MGPPPMAPFKVSTALLALLMLMYASLANAALQFTQSTYTVSESGRFASIEIARGAGDVGQVTALLDVAEGSAVDGFDFRGLSKEPVVLEADQDRVTVRVAIFDNFWSDGSRSANLVLTQPDGAITTATLLITDDEEAEAQPSNKEAESFLRLFERSGIVVTPTLIHTTILPTTTATAATSITATTTAATTATAITTATATATTTATATATATATMVTATTTTATTATATATATTTAATATTTAATATTTAATATTTATVTATATSTVPTPTPTPTPTLTTQFTLTATPTPTQSICIPDCQSPPQCNTGWEETYENCFICGPPDISYRDCNGDCLGTAFINKCGVCVGGNTTRAPDTDIDQCGVCFGNGTSCVDCAGTVNGTAKVDSCGVCNGDNSTCTVLESVCPNAGPNVAGRVISAYGAGFTDGVNGTARVVLCLLYENATNPDLDAPDHVIIATVVSISEVTCVLDEFETSGDKLVRLRVDNEIVNGSDTYLALASQPAILGGSFSLQIDTEGYVLQIPVVSFEGVNEDDLYCVFSLQFDSPAPTVATLYINDTESYILCEAPELARSQAGNVTVAYGCNAIATGLTPIEYYAPAAETTFGRFTNSAGAIRVGFDVPVTLNGTGGSLVDLDIPCSLLFTGETMGLLGANAKCRFYADELLVIALSADATIVPYDTLHFNPNTLIQLNEEISLPLSSTAVVLPPTVLPTPVAVINMPQMLGDCTPLVADGSDSFGNAGRQLTFSWDVQPRNDAINQALSQLTPSSDVLELPVDAVEEGVTYEVSLRVANFLATSVLAVQTVVRQAGSIPSVYVPGQNPLPVNSYEGVVLNAVTSFAPCGAQSAVTFEWTVVSGTPPASLDGQKTLPSIYFGPGDLQTGETLILRVTATQGTLQALYDIKLEVAPAALRVYQVGGIERSVGQFNDLPLTVAILSLDQVARNVSIAWTCRNPLADGGSCIVLKQPGFGTLEMPAATITTIPGDGATHYFSITVAANQLVQYTSVAYEFVVTVRDLEDTSLPAYTSSVRIEPIPGFNVVPALDATRFWDRIPSQSLTVQSTLSPPEGTTIYQWSTVAGTVDAFDIPVYPLATLNLNDDNVYDGPMGAASLVLKGQYLLPNQVYRFRVDMTTTVGAEVRTGYAILQVTFNALPTSGTFTIDPTGPGVPVETLFKFSAAGWTSDPAQLPLKYAFSFVYGNGDNAILRSPQNQHVLSTTLPQPIAPLTSVKAYVAVTQRNGGSYTPDALEIDMQSCTPTTDAQLTALLNLYNTHYTAFTNVGDYRSAQALTTMVSVCLIGTGDTGSRRRAAVATRAVSTSALNNALTQLMLNGATTFANLPDTVLDVTTTTCSLDTIARIVTPPPTNVQALLPAGVAALVNSMDNAFVPTLESLPMSFLNCFTRLQGSALSSSSLTSQQAALTSQSFNLVNTMYLANVGCDQATATFPQTDPVAGVLWALGRTKAAGVNFTVSAPDGFTNPVASVDFPALFALPNINCFCVQVLQVPNTTYAYVPRPSGYLITHDNIIDAASGAAGITGNDIVDVVTSPTFGGFGLLGNTLSISLRDCSVGSNGENVNLPTDITNLDGNAVTIFVPFDDPTQFFQDVNKVCVYLQSFPNGTQIWDTAGVNLVSASPLGAYCSAEHLSDFAVLQQLTSFVPDQLVSSEPFPAWASALIVILAVALIALVAVSIYIIARRNRKDRHMLEEQIRNKRILDFNTINEEDTGIGGLSPPTYVPPVTKKVPEGYVPRLPPYVPPPTYQEFLANKNALLRLGTTAPKPIDMWDNFNSLVIHGDEDDEDDEDDDEDDDEEDEEEEDEEVDEEEDEEADEDEDEDEDEEEDEEDKEEDDDEDEVEEDEEEEEDDEEDVAVDDGSDEDA